MASLICPEPLKVKKDASSEEKLGYGRYSTVYRIKVKKGEDKGKEYALKRVPRIPDNGQRKGQDITNLFKREVAALYAASRVREPCSS